MTQSSVGIPSVAVPRSLFRTYILDEDPAYQQTNHIRLSAISAVHHDLGI
jgi:hypothetical protein